MRNHSSVFSDTITSSLPSPEADKVWPEWNHWLSLACSWHHLNIWFSWQRDHIWHIDKLCGCAAPLGFNTHDKILQQAPELLTMNVTNIILLTNPLPILHNLADSKAWSATRTSKTQHCWQKTLGIHSFPLLATAAITGPHHWQKTSGIPSSSDATAACPCWGGATLSRGTGRGCLFWSTHDQWPCQPETTGTRKDFKSMSQLHSLH